jgi:hypothetical protein
LNSGLLNVWRENGAYLRYGDAKCVFLATTGLALFLSFSSFFGLIEGSPWSAVTNFGSTQLGPYGAAAAICFLLATLVALLAAIPTLSKRMLRVRLLLWFDGLLARGRLSPSPSKVIFFQDVRRFQSESDYTHDHARWGLFRNPLPPRDEHSLFREIRDDGAMKDHEVCGPVFSRLGTDLKRAFLDEFEIMAEQHNPVVRRVVRRTRSMLESKGLLRPISVSLHPRNEDRLPSQLFDGQGLVMNLAFQSAYADAEEFSRLYASRCPGAGFLKTIVLRRIGSSAKAGLGW